jgi:hypothetical protein
MREAEIAERTEKYKEKKPVAKIYLYIFYAVILLLLVFTVIFQNKLFFFLFLTAFSTIVNYHTNMSSIRFNPQPEVFSGLLITKVAGLNYAIAMLLVPTLFVGVYTARLDKDTFISLIFTIAACFIIDRFMIFGFLFTSLLLVTLKFVLALILNFILETSPQEILFEHVLGFISNIIAFLAFGNFFYYLFIS